MAQKYDSLVRLLLIGNLGVGKTCLIYQYICNEFQEEQKSTIGVDFKIKIIKLDDKVVKIQIWDTSGQERFESITKQSVTKAQGCILVYDICSRRSFDSLRKWLSFVQDHAKEGTPIIIIGNKTDLDRREVSTATAEQFANETNLRLYETSAKDRDSLNRPFEDLCRDILRRKAISAAPDPGVIDLQNSHQEARAKLSTDQTEDKTEVTSRRTCC